MMKSTITDEKELAYYRISGLEILKNQNIGVHLLENKTDIYNHIARVMADTVRENNQKGEATAFILPVGPTGQYRRFARICNREGISCSNLVTINMDEYVDENGKYIPMVNPLSFRAFMKKNLFDVLDESLKVKPGNIYFPDPENTAEIETVINQIGKVDICFGGVGINGHIAFNEPITDGSVSAEDFENIKTRVVKLSRDTLIINSIKIGGYIDFMPRQAVTIGMYEIFKAKKLRFYMEHNWQSAVLRRAVFEKPNPWCPVTYLKEHKDAEITVSGNVLKQYINL